MKTFLISDTHFGHENILRFRREDGTSLRPHSSIAEHDECLVYNWNRVVGPTDKVYHLGDIGFKNATQTRAVLSRLNGTKVLIKGNHDVHKLSLYQEYFKDVRATHVMDGLVLAHVPLHPTCLDRWRGQIHGHTHDRCINDHKYFNVSVENIKYTPIDFEEIRDYFRTIGNT